jgi:hypothetical protein
MEKLMINLIKVNDINQIRENMFIPKSMDMEEIGAKDINDVVAILERCYQLSKETFLATYRDSVIGIYGLQEYNQYTGIPWLISENIQKEYIQEFLILSKAIVNKWKKEYRVLQNKTSSEHLSAHKWLKYLGFKIHYNEPIIISESLTMYKFDWVDLNEISNDKSFQKRENI